MKNLLTKEDVYQPQFLKMPHEFFYGTKYTAMRIESKVAYMLLLNQLSLSVANDWVNDQGQVFVKLSRKKLMLLLSIKGTQKMAQVIMRGVIRKLKMHHIEHVIDQFRQVSISQEIFNPKRYIQTMIYNSICEANTKMMGHIGYHFGYC